MFLHWIVILEQGGRGQLRFQPQLGQLIAATAENGVVIFDVETDTHIYSLQVFLL
jgi:hypothetical protein